MGGKGGAPAPPDYSQLAASSVEAAQVAQQTSREQLDWAKQQYADQAPLTKSYVQSMVDTTNENVQAAKDAQARLQSTYYPIENQFAQEAQTYNDPARAAERSATAQADVASTFAGQRKAALQSLEGFGIDPSQTRYGALDLGTRISQAAAQSAAGTNSRQQSEAAGLALQGEAINIGRGYPGQVAQAYGTAVNAGSAGVNAGLNTSSTYGNMMGSPATWAGIQSANLAGAGNLMNQGYQNQLGAFQANAAIAQNQASGIGSLVGGLGAAGIIAI
jgi:hypothetical protein